MPDPFVYHAPTPVTAPLYAAIREAAAVCGKGFEEALSMSLNFGRQARYDLVNESARSFASAIEAYCPGHADAGLAIECVRLARMRANESIATSAALDWKTPLVDARMWACAAIALNSPDVERA